MCSCFGLRCFDIGELAFGSRSIRIYIYIIPTCTVLLFTYHMLGNKLDDHWPFSNPRIACLLVEGGAHRRLPGSSLEERGTGGIK